jgi:uncharacterized protein (TIGR03067 family)
MFFETLMLTMVGVAGISEGEQKVASMKDFDGLQGKWTAVMAEQDGREAADIVGHVLVFEGDKFSIKEKGVTIYGGALALDMSASPGAIDFKHTDYLSKGKTWRGIYKMDGDTLTICDNAPDLKRSRPTSFKTQPKSGLVMVVFKRAQE